jgi:hypothetical protein
LQTFDHEDAHQDSDFGWDSGEQSAYQSGSEELDDVEMGIPAHDEACLSSKDEASLSGEDEANLSGEDEANLSGEDKDGPSGEDVPSVFQLPAITSEEVVVPYHGQTFSDEEDFFMTVSLYAQAAGFTIRRDRAVRNKAGELRKRDLVCSWARTAAYNKNETADRNRPSQSTGCSFRVRASFKSDLEKWQMIHVSLLHNHAMVAPEQRRFMSSERKLPENIKSEVLLLRRAGVSVTQIRAVLKVKFGKDTTWLYDDIYNFLYRQSGESAKRTLDAQSLIEALQE